MNQSRTGTHRAVQAATTEATTAAADVLADTPVHPDAATWDDAAEGRLDIRAAEDGTIKTPTGLLLAEVARLAAGARRAATRAREYREEADALEAHAAHSAHRLSVYRAALEALTDPADQQETP